MAKKSAAATRVDLDQRNEEHAMEIYLLVNETQARELMAGQVPEEVREMARAAIDWSLETGSLSFAGRRQARG